MRYRSRPKKITAALLFGLGLLFAQCFWQKGGERAYGQVLQVDPAFEMRMPAGIPPALWQKYIPADNAVTRAKISLGKSLYFDKRLSLDGTVSCATCHDPAKGFADGKPRAVGVNGIIGRRNAPSLLNSMFNESFFWDGRARSLEDQAEQPMINDSEMGLKTLDEVVRRVTSIPGYQEQFYKVFGTETITIEDIAKAVACFERTLISGDSPFDLFIAGNEKAITPSQRLGWELFRGKAKCINCHSYDRSTLFFTDFKFHNTGVAAKSGQVGSAISLLESPSGGNVAASPSDPERFTEMGRYAITGLLRDVGAFKTPSLRNVELTSPYMHDGPEKTLIDVVRYYNRGGRLNPYLDSDIRPLNLTEEEINSLVDFLKALTSDEALRSMYNSKPQTRAPISNLKIVQ